MTNNVSAHVDVDKLRQQETATVTAGQAMNSMAHVISVEAGAALHIAGCMAWGTSYSMLLDLQIDPLE
jgi:hypothetical protein